MEMIGILIALGFILGILVVVGIIETCIMAPRWANNILNELKKHTKELEEIKNKDKAKKNILEDL